MDKCLEFFHLEIPSCFGKFYKLWLHISAFRKIKLDHVYVKLYF